MHTILNSVNAIYGVTGCFVCDREGNVVSSALPDLFDQYTLADIGRTLTRTIDGLSTLRRGKVVDIDLVYQNSRFVTMNLSGGCLCILCVRNVNLPLLTLTANMAVKKLNSLLTSTGANEKPSPPPPAPTPGSQALNAELKNILTSALRQGILLKASGDAAIRLRCPNASHLAPHLEENVLDLAGLEKQSAHIAQILESLGYQPETRFNLLQGEQRLRFTHPEKQHGVEVFLSTLVLYHRLPFTERLTLEDDTLPLADLLLWKLQYIEPDEATLEAIYILLKEHELGKSDEVEKIDTSRILELFVNDWGWYKTGTTNLAKAITWAQEKYGEQAASFVERVYRLQQLINAAPKSVGWQVRARVGESMRWYEEPE